MKYLISGCTGCIGFSLIKKLNIEDNEISVILNPGSNRNASIENISNLSVYHIELGRYLESEISGNFDVFIHMAWSGGLARDEFERNQFSSFATIEALTLAQRLGCRKFISIGSQAEYGITGEVLNETTRCLPVSEFGIAKLNTYYRLHERAKNLDIEVNWLRVLSAYGPFDRKSSMIMTTIHSLLTGRDIKLSSCTQKWDFLHADDIADAIIGVSHTFEIADLYVIGSDEKLELKNYVREIISGFNVNEEEIFGTAKIKQGSLVELQSDSSLLRNDIGWYPKVKFSEGIQSLILHERMKL